MLRVTVFVEKKLFLLNIVSSQFIEHSIPTTMFDVLCSERRAYSWLGEKWLIQPLPSRAPMQYKQNPLQLKWSVFYREPVLGDYFLTWLVRQKQVNDIVLNATGLVFWRCDYTRFWFQISKRLRTGGHELIKEVGVYSVKFVPTKKITFARWPWNKKFINNWFFYQNDS